MNSNDFGELIYESPSSGIIRKFVGLFYTVIMLIGGILLLVGPFVFDSMEWEFINFVGIALLFISLISYTYWVKEKIRIYERGFSGPTHRSSYFPLWPKPIHINDILGYWVHKDLQGDIRCDILLNNGKIKRIWGNSFDKKTRSIFKYKILKQLPRLTQTEFQEHKLKIKAKR